MMLVCDLDVLGRQIYLDGGGELSWHLLDSCVRASYRAEALERWEALKDGFVKALTSKSRAKK